MTLFAHGVMASLMLVPFTDSTILIAASGIIGTLPDVVPIDETSKGIWTKKYEDWHKPKWKWMWAIPQLALHIGLDKIFHKKTGGWKTSAYVVEILFWLLFIFLLLKGWL